ncbi:MAG: sugar phosphate isomerase/epimerase [Eubacteriales bacterium]|nr:sugar phosphate isomerase/epimerase [Eubacteriales bacterium]
MQRNHIYVAGMSYNLRRTICDYGFGIEIDRFCTAVEMERAGVIESTIAFCNSLSDPARIPKEDDPSSASSSTFGDSVGGGAPGSRIVPSLASFAPAPDHTIHLPAILHAPFNELHPAAIDPQALALARHRFEQAYVTARELGIHRMVVHTGWIPFVYFKSWQLERAAMFWQDFIKDKDNITILIENVMEDEPDMLADLIRSIDHPRIRAALDTGHARCASRIPVIEWIQCLGSSIAHFHIHENDGSADQHLPLGSGCLDVEELLAAIDECCPKNCTMTIESHDSYSAAQCLETHGFLD